MGKVSKGGLAPWQKRRAAELLRENLNGRIRLTDDGLEIVCGVLLIYGTGADLCSTFLTGPAISRSLGLL
jgi:hypothetical protein